MGIRSVGRNASKNGAAFGASFTMLGIVGAAVGGIYAYKYITSLPAVDNVDGPEYTQLTYHYNATRKAADGYNHQFKFGYTGKLDHIDWGTGSSNGSEIDFGKKRVTSPVYTSDRHNYTIRIYGDVTSIYFFDLGTYGSYTVMDLDDRDVTEIIFGGHITEIPKYAFQGSDLTLNKVTFSSSLRKICESAFYSNRYIAELNIPKNAEIYCASNMSTPFADCDGLFKVVLNDGVKIISNNVSNNGAFYYCDNLEEIVVGCEDAKNICTGCSKLKKITFTSNVKRIYANAFMSSCTYPGINEIRIPSTVEKVGFMPNGQSSSSGGGAIMGGGSVARIVIEDGVGEVCNGAFTGMYGIQGGNTEIYIGAKVVGNSIFGGSLKCRKYTISSTVQKMGNDVFSGVSIPYGYPVTITIPETVTEIGSLGLYSSPITKFTSYAKLSRVTSSTFSFNSNSCPNVILRNVGTIQGDYSNYVFANTSIVNIDVDAEFIGSNVFGGGNRNITLGEHVKQIGYEYGDNTFSGTTLQSDFKLPNSIQYINTNAFYSCNFHNVVLPKYLPVIAANLFSTNRNNHIDSVTLPDTLEIINESAFYGSALNQDIIFPNTLKIIGRAAFTNVNNIKKLELNTGLLKIGTEAFKNCLYASAGTIKLPKTLTEIGYNAFSGYGASNGSEDPIVYDCTEFTTVPQIKSYVNDDNQEGNNPFGTNNYKIKLKNSMSNAFYSEPTWSTVLQDTSHIEWI